MQFRRAEIPTYLLPATVSADDALFYAPIQDRPDTEVSDMTEDESLKLFAMGRDSWNAWAVERLTERQALWTGSPEADWEESDAARS